MGVQVHFTPLYGVHSNHHALSYLLTIDGFNILLDCGWTTAFDPSYLQALAPIAPSIHAVLISHPDIAHIGALPYAVAKLGLSATIFSTLPVWRMAQMFMYDAFLSLDAQKPFTTFNLDHVDAAFDVTDDKNRTRFQLLKYQQHFPLDPLPLGNGIVITPHPAGHMLGATVWNIKKDTESIVYAVHFNHRRERHLNPTTLASFSRPSHLVLAATNACTHTETHKASDLIDKITAVLSRSGNVLIPVDTAGRVIELAVQLEAACANHPELVQVSLVILHELSARTFDYARSMIEWMSDEVVKRFDISRENLFLFKHVKLMQSLDGLDALPKPYVVLASSASMDMGFSRQLFVRWCRDPKNALILVDRPEPDTLYAQLYDHYKSQTIQSTTTPNPYSTSLVIQKKEFLQGEELEQWREEERSKAAAEQEQLRQKEEEAKLAQEALQRSKSSSADMVGSVSHLSEQRSDGTIQIPTSPGSIQDETEHYEKFMYTQLRRLGVLPQKPSTEVFPFIQESRPSWDDYGQVIDTTRFMIGEDPGEGAPVRDMDPNTNQEKTAEPDAEPEIIPTKYVEELVNITVFCEVWLIDNTGLSDGDSLKRLVKEVEPRNVTLVAGTEEETIHLKQYLLSNLFNTAVYKKSSKQGSKNSADGKKDSFFVHAPLQGQFIDITSHTSVVDFTLQDSLVSDVAWSRVGMSNVAFVDAMVIGNPVDPDVQMLGPSNRRTLDIDSMEVDTSVVSTTPTSDLDNASFGHPTLFVGTVMLNQLKDTLGKAGLKAEFAGGALCVENSETGAVVLLKKVGAQHIVIEGALSEEYLTVKDLLYEELVIPR